MDFNSKISAIARKCKIKSIVTYRKSKSFIANLSIKTKFLSLVIVLNLLTVSAFTYYSYYETQKHQMIELDKHLQTVAHGSHNLLKSYHDKIKSQKSIKEKRYLEVLKQLSEYAKNVDVAYVYSFMNYKGKVVYTSTSATDEEYENGEYDNFFDEYADASDVLKEMMTKQTKKIVYEETEDEWGNFRSILIPYTNKNGEYYIIGIDMEINYIQAILQDIVINTLIVGAIIFIVSILLFLVVLHFVLRQIPIIKNGLEEFFKFINKEQDSIKLINMHSTDELGQIATIINTNILLNKKNIKKDMDLLNNIAEVSESISTGSFKSRLDKEAHSPALNEAKDVINNMLTNIETIISKVTNLIEEYSKHNFIASLEQDLYKDEIQFLINSVNKLGSNISEEMLKSAHESLVIQKNSNYLREFIENIVYSFNSLSKDIYKFSEQLNASEKLKIIIK